MLQRGAVKKLHDDVLADDVLTAVILAYVVDSADVGMVERRCCLRFPAKAFQSLSIFGDFIGQELQGDETMQPGVFSFVDHAHAASTQLFNDAVMGDGLANHAKTRMLRAGFILRRRLQRVNGMRTGRWCPKIAS